MWEKVTKYKLSLKKNLIYEYCQEAYKKSSNFDITFITSDNFSIPAHRIILALTSDLIKNLEFSDCIQIMLPDYSRKVAEGFVQFLYSGEVMIDYEDRNDFMSLCKEMMVNVPGLSNDTAEILDETTVEEMIKREPDHIEVVQVKTGHFEEVEEQPVQDEMEYEEESDLKNENEELIPDAPPSDEESSSYHFASDSSHHSPEIRLKTNQYLPRKPDGIKSEAKLKKAINAVKSRKMNTMEAARKFGIPKTTLYRRLKGWKN